MSFKIEGVARVAFTNTPGQVPAAPDNGEIKVHQADSYLVTRRADGTMRKTPLDGLLVDGIAQAASIGFKPDLSETFARDIDEKSRERTMSFLDFMPLAIRKGYAAGSVVDLTAYLQKALDSGRDLFMPPNMPTVRVTQALQQTVARQVVEWAISTPMLYDAPIGSAITPAWIIRESAESAILRGLNVNHQGAGARYKAPTMGGGSITFGNTILLMADRCRSEGCIVYNAWDNGIGIGRASLTQLQQFNGSPTSAVVAKAQTFNCGAGYHPEGEQAGGGVNILCGSRSLVLDCTDIGSLTGFIGDYASGAGGVVFGCRSIQPRTSETNSSIGGGLPADQIGGFGFYFGANHLAIIGCSVDDAAQVGFWIDGFGFDVHLTACRAKGCRKQGLLLQGGFNSATDFIAEACSYLNSGGYPAIEVRGTWVDGANQWSSGLVVNNPTTRGEFHTWGVLAKADNGRAVNGALNGGYLNGTLGPFMREDQTGFNAVGYRQDGYNATQSHGIQFFKTTNRSAATEAFGSAANNGNLILADEANPLLRLASGIDPVRKRGVIQTSDIGTPATLPTEMNPNGGPVLLGKAAPAQNDPSNLVYLPAMAGPPTAAPPTYPGLVPIVFDVANARIYSYVGGAWKQVGFA